MTRWHIEKSVPGFFAASRTHKGAHQMIEISAHCLACAKTDILAAHGGTVDLRGHNRGPHAEFLKAMQRVVNEEQANDAQPRQ